jgi:predicted phosphoribosyltransferase
MPRPFRDRRDAGQHLAARLAAYAQEPDVLVLALPRGGVPVAYEVARALDAPLDVFLVRKLGVPGHEELAMGAIAPGGVRVLNRRVLREAAVPASAVEAVAAAEERELARREREYRGDRPPPEIGGKTAILVDDGLATGASMHAAVRALRLQGPRRVVVAVPIAAPETCEAFRAEVDEIVCARTPDPFFAVGLWYEDFSRTSDEEVRDLLARARHPVAGRRGSATATRFAADAHGALRGAAHPLPDAADVDPILRLVGVARFVLLGEASHGMHEFYALRAELTKRLIAEHEPVLRGHAPAVGDAPPPSGAAPGRPTAVGHGPTARAGRAAGRPRHRFCRLGARR